QVVYDVDDDNSLISPEDGIPHAEFPLASPPTTTFTLGPQASVHNPSGCFGGPANVWPRGFPLDAINNPDCSGCESSQVGALDGVRGGEPRPLGVVLALVNHDPDVDAIYRLTYSSRGASEGGLEIIPPAAFTPSNGQVSLVLR
ncbi:unnamed protein product, partial [Laminaria digitata]